MTFVAGGAAGAVASSFANNSNKVQAIKPIGQDPKKSLAGSIFNKGNAQFGALTHLKGVNGGNTGPSGTQGQQPPKGLGSIGNMLAGNFGSITSQRGTPGANGHVGMSAQAQGRNQDIDNMTDGDKLEKIALGMDASNIMAAAA